MISHVLHHYSAHKPNSKNSETHTIVPGNQYTTPKNKTREKTERKSKTYHHKAQKLAAS
jgi:hypothetical protein